MNASIENQRSVYDRTRNELRKQLMDFDNIKGDAKSQDMANRPSSTIYIYKMFLAQEKALY